MKALTLTDMAFIALCKEAKLPEPVQEVRFCPTRRWRFDFGFISEKVAVECEGGIWKKKARHTSGIGYLSDMEKYNTAVLLGWRVLRYTPQQIIGDKAIGEIKWLLKGEE